MTLTLAPSGPSTQTCAPLRTPRSLASRGLISHEHVLLKLGEPAVGPRLLAAALVLDETARGEDQRVVLGEILLLDRGIHGGQTVKLPIRIGRIVLHQIPVGSVERLPVQRDRIREVPHHRACLGVAERRALMLDGDPLDAARKVGLPVGLGPGHGVDRRTLLRRQVLVPAQLHEHLHGELGIAVLDLRPDRVHALGEQVLAVALHAEPGAEGQAAFRDALGHVVQVGRAGMPHLGGAPAGPRHTVILAVRRSAHGLQRCLVERVLVGHVQLEPLRRLAGIADGPHARVDLEGDVLDIGLVAVPP